MYCYTRTDMCLTWDEVKQVLYRLRLHAQGSFTDGMQKSFLPESDKAVT